MGDAAEWLERVQQETGTPIPLLEERPTLDADQALAWAAFCTLSRRRPVFFGGLGAIPLTDVEAYCRLHGVTDEEQGELLPLLEVLDCAYMAAAVRKPEEGGGGGV